MVPDVSSLLSVLTRDRLVELGRAAGVAISANAKKERQVQALLDSSDLQFASVVATLRRDELKAACRVFGLDASGRARHDLARRLLVARGEDAESGPAPIFQTQQSSRDVPAPGDVVRVRHRQYLVEDVASPQAPWRASGPVMAHRVALVGLDDDAQGRRLEVLWELELGARVLAASGTLAPPERLDPARRFGAYLASLRWHGVTATEAKRFQAPFRAGIKLMNHQLVPLERALDLPRANLFVADDVGLGKTIEAGLILQELRLRQRVDFVLIVCPAAICLQWQDEMWRRFGLRFEVMSRDFVARRRQERGFGINPWTTHARFIVSHHLLRRPEYRDPLLAHVGERARKSLLVLDEAHVAAPASATRYAVDSRITRVIRDVAPRFENRLFLSATPHNGHSNSFSALLELLDPQRFTRGVPVSPAQRDKIMVRRLKSDLQALGVERFPRRHVVRLELTHEDGTWTATAHDSETGETAVSGRVAVGGAGAGSTEAFELEIARKLAAYTDLMRPRAKAARIVFIRLQQRLLSGVEAFARTLGRHVAHVGRGEKAQSTLPIADANDDADDTVQGLDETEAEAAEDDRAARASARLLTTEARARAALDELVALAERYRGAPDAKARCVLDWIRRNQCPAVRLGGADRASAAADRCWYDRRLIIFTEFGATLNHLERLLRAAFEGTDRGAERLATFRGGMGDAQRDALQRAWNAPPDTEPVRVLLATDAAREGVNLQGYCAHLFHYDVPWNPARLEQRNGRIDRTMQPADDVCCHYFVYPDRPEDRVLDTLVRKIGVIQREVGSLGTVILDRLEAALADGIDGDTEARLTDAEAAQGRRDVVQRELESQRQQRTLEREIDAAGKILDASRQATGFQPDLLRQAVNEALAMIGAAPLAEVEPGVFRLPALPDAWQATVDTLRPSRDPEEALWQWRQRPPLDVVFEPPTRLRADRVHLHLEHPLVTRLLSRFLAQGFGAEDLSRVTVLADAESARLHAVAIGRLALFGAGASRLHDELVYVTAVLDGGTGGEPDILDSAAENRVLDRMWRIFGASPGDEAAGNMAARDPVPDTARRRLCDRAAPLFAALWKALVEEADGLAHDAEDKLAVRGTKEATDLQALLVAQKQAIDKELRQQLRFTFTEAEKAQARQWQDDRLHMEDRLERIDREIEHEPGELEALYRILTRRLEPVGLVYLWPGS